MKFNKLAGVLGLVALIAVPASAVAQQRHEGVGVGVKGGPLFSSIKAANVTSGASNRTGWIGGLFLGGNRPGVVGVGVDLLYAKKGSKDSSGGKTSLDYIDVPVYLRINAGSSSTSGVSVFGIAGVDLNFLLKAQSPGGADIKSKFERADYGAALGLGVEVTRVTIEGRYTKGMGNIAKDKSAPVLKTQSFAVMIGVRFN